MFTTYSPASHERFELLLSRQSAKVDVCSQLLLSPALRRSLPLKADTYLLVLKSPLSLGLSP